MKIGKFCNNNNISEKESWKKSLSKLINIISDAGFDNLYLAAEYSLAAGERIDAVLLGDGLDGKHKALIVELKQWSSDRIEYNDDLGFPFILVKANPDYRTRHTTIDSRLCKMKIVKKYMARPSCRSRHIFSIMRLLTFLRICK